MTHPCISFGDVINFFFILEIEEAFTMLMTFFTLIKCTVDGVESNYIAIVLLRLLYTASSIYQSAFELLAIDKKVNIYSEHIIYQDRFKLYCLISNKTEYVEQKVKYKNIEIQGNIKTERIDGSIHNSSKFIYYLHHWRIK